MYPLAPGLIDSHVHLGEIPGMRPDQEAQHPDIALDGRALDPTELAVGAAH
jgi:imidazolonepropionase-like amidohydrolase